MSHQQYLLGQAGSHSREVLGSDDHRSHSGSDVIVKEETIITPPASDTPSASITLKPTSTPLGEESAQAMDMDQPPDSPVSPKQDDLLSGANEVGVEVEMATLGVCSTPDRKDDGKRDASS